MKVDNASSYAILDRCVPPKVGSSGTKVLKATLWAIRSLSAIGQDVEVDRKEVARRTGYAVRAIEEAVRSLQIEGALIKTSLHSPSGSERFHVNYERLYDWLADHDKSAINNILHRGAPPKSVIPADNSRSLLPPKSVIPADSLKEVSAISAEDSAKKKGDRSAPLSDFDWESDCPALLNTQAVRDALDEWFAYRRERKLAKWKPRTIRTNLAKFEPHGPAAFVAAVEESISNGWQGVFPPKQGGMSHAKRVDAMNEPYDDSVFMSRIIRIGREEDDDADS